MTLPVNQLVCYLAALAKSKDIHLASAFYTGQSINNRIINLRMKSRYDDLWIAYDNYFAEKIVSPYLDNKAYTDEVINFNISNIPELTTLLEDKSLLAKEINGLLGFEECWEWALSKLGLTEGIYKD